MPAVLAIVLTVILATAVGVAVERRDNAAAHAARLLVLRTMLWALVPFVAYVNIARAHLSVDAALSIAIAIVAVLAAGAIAWRLGRGPLALPNATVGASIVCTIQANTAYFGLPLVAALFSRAQLSQAVVYDGLVSLPMFVLVSFSVGARFGHAEDAGLRAQLRAALLRNPVLLAVIVALLVPDAWAPEVLVAPSHVAVLALLPLGFFVVGVTLGDEAKDGMLRIPPPLTPAIAAVVVLRMAFVPLVLVLAGLFLIDVPAPFYLMAAMPVGVNTVLVGHATGLDLRLTSSSIAWATTVALVGITVLALVRALA
ncbi:MAG TPA: transporter [Conexibacter sp.]|jgi:predicted permease|nr:transporter [Conexibacter sp.]